MSRTVRRTLAALLAIPAIALTVHTQTALPTFTDVTKAAGIRFRHDSGAFGKKYLPETMGAGGAFLDADGDGAQDLLFVNSGRLQPAASPKAKPAVMALYRNNHDGTFTDVTAGAGLNVELYGLGVAAADYDNDG